MFCFLQILLLWNQPVAVRFFCVFPAHVWLLSLFFSLQSQSQSNQTPPKPAAQVSTVKPAQSEVLDIPL